MNHWRVRRFYGFGAGHVPLLPNAYRHPPVPDPFFSGLRTVSRAMFLDDGAIRRILTTAPVFAIALAVLWILIAKLTLVPSDHSDIEVVLMRIIADPIEPVPQPLPGPLVEVVAPGAAPQVAAVPATVQPPEPAIEIPAPVPAPRTRLAAVEPPPTRVMPEFALPSLPPSLEEQSVRPSRTDRRTSVEVVAQTRPRPTLAMPQAVPFPPIADPLPPVEPTVRSRVVRQAPPEASRPRVAPTPVAPAAPVADFPRVQVTRRAAHFEAPVTERLRPRPTLAAVPIVLAGPETPQRGVRRMAPRPPRAEPRARTFEVAALGVGSMTAVSLPGSRGSSSRRSQRVDFRAASTAPAAGRTEESLSGVPLGVLAACVSDREEDSLKQKLVASVGGRLECRSQAGSYRFVEMKNLNAFLMWIERAPGRGVEDRCGELRHALHCLGRGSSWL